MRTTRPTACSGAAEIARARLLVAACLLAALGTVPLARAVENVAVLRPGQALEQELAPGELHTYRVELPAGRPWRIEALQQGVDITLTCRLAGSEAGDALTVDSPFDRRGIEVLAIRPGTAGAAFIEVRAREQGAPRGSYRIELDELDPAEPADADRLEAELALTAAGRAYALGTTAGRRQALDDYGRALGHWQRLGRQREAARALYCVAVLHRLLDSSEQALAPGREALELWRALGDAYWEATTLNQLGLAHYLLGQTGAAQPMFEEALAACRRAGSAPCEAVVHANLCLMDLVRGDLPAGRACYERILPLLEAMVAPSLEATAHSNIGRVHDLLGEPDQALAHYQRALELSRVAGDRRAEARTLNNLAVLHRLLGELDEALIAYGRALEVFTALEDRRWQARTLGNLGLLYHTLGEPGKARASLDQALALWRAVGAPKGEAATLATLGTMLLDHGRPAEAVPVLEQSLALRRSLDDRRGEALVLIELGRAQMALGDPEKARASLEKAASWLEETGDHSGEALAARRLGELHEALHQPAEARTHLLRAAELSATGRQPAARVEALCALARVEHGSGSTGPALGHLETALDLIEQLRRQVPGPDLRASFAATAHAAHGLHVELLMTQHQTDPSAGHDRRALEAVHQERARTLVELLHEAGAPPAPDLDPALRQRREELIRRLHATTGRLLAGSTDDHLRADQARLSRELDLVEAEIRGATPDLADVTFPSRITVPEIQRLLDPATLLLVYHLGSRRSFLWAVDPTSVHSFELPDAGTIEGAARRVHDLLRTYDPGRRADDWQAAVELGQLVLAPAAGLLRQQRLVILADGALCYIPFAALALPDDPSDDPSDGLSSDPDALPRLVIERHEVVSVGSLAALAIGRERARPRPLRRGSLVVVADPVLGPDDPRLDSGPAANHASATTFERLPGSRREAEAIAAMAPGDVLGALGLEASRSWLLTTDLTGYDVLHLATHGVIDTESPALSGLLLSSVTADGAPRDGFLGLHDITGLRLDTDLVVLSGCRTALGRQLAGEGLVGLARGFMYAGAPRVIASLWRVQDHATADLMIEMYRAMWVDGLTPAAALRKAQLGALASRRRRDPFFWAAFVLQGDWR